MVVNYQPYHHHHGSKVHLQVLVSDSQALVLVPLPVPWLSMSEDAEQWGVSEWLLVIFTHVLLAFEVSFNHFNHYLTTTNVNRYWNTTVNLVTVNGPVLFNVDQALLIIIKPLFTTYWLSLIDLVQQPVFWPNLRSLQWTSCELTTYCVC